MTRLSLRYTRYVLTVLSSLGFGTTLQ